MLDFHLARFEVNVSPPLGHPLCGGWIKPAEVVEDPLLLRGVVLMGAGLPVVLAAADWTGVMDESHRLWTEALADGAHTTPDRVALHCVHQHNAPFIDHVGNQLLKKAGADPLLFDEIFVERLIERSKESVRASLTTSVPVTHISVGKAEVKEVACNRRVIGPDGKILHTRYSATKDPAARAAPVGTIDPFLRCVSFHRNDRALARLYYYTTHPMSYYGDGRVTSDFVGLARKRTDEREPETLHVYFTGAAGNVTAGKYNDGAKATRLVLMDRIHDAMLAAEKESDAHRHRLDSANWVTAPFQFGPRSGLDLDRLKAIVADPTQTVVNRNRSAMACGWLARLESKRPILLSRLDIGHDAATLLHLPAETFVEYQLDAQKDFPGRFLATAAYGDGGPWYIPLTRSFAEGGYEPSAAFVAEGTEPTYRKAIQDLLRGRKI